ncbi:hypothetical protein [Nocardia sp. NPDC004750]
MDNSAEYPSCILEKNPPVAARKHEQACEGLFTSTDMPENADAARKKGVIYASDSAVKTLGRTDARPLSDDQNQDEFGMCVIAGSSSKWPARQGSLPKAAVPALV